MRAKSSRRLVRECGWQGIEQLEQRSLLANSAFPLISDLQNPNNTVVRLQTNFGDIDFELFDTAAPITVANFLKYVRDGDFDKTFFHRYATNQDTTPFVLQGGLGRLKAPSPSGTINKDGTQGVNAAWETIPTDAPITNEFNQSNLERTIAMARIGGQVNSATSQFFINLDDNTFLDTVDQGFTVFGRVATNASWAVVQSIITSVSRPFHLTGQTGELFEDLPTTGGFNGTRTTAATNVNEDQMVTIRDAEIIKPQGVAAFYQFRYYFPEGFAGSTINEFVSIGNTGSSTAHYQVIIRSETRDERPAGNNVDFWYRDKVVATRTLAGNRRGGETMSTFVEPQNNLVPKQGKPYGIEVWSTTPLAVSLSHYDFGSAGIETFTTTTATKWTLPDLQKGADLNDVVLWQNVSDEVATVTCKFIYSGQAPQTFVFTTEAFRRGGLALANIPQLADGRFTLQITSDRPLIVSATHYDTAGADKGAAMQLAIAGEAQVRGVLPLASASNTGNAVSDQISFYNPNGTAAIITLIFTFSDGTPELTLSPAQLILTPGGRATYNTSTIPSIQGKTFTVRYQSGASPVYATTLHIEHGDIASSRFGYSAATSHLFGEGFMDGARAGDDLFETIAVFNPNAASFGATPQDAAVTIRFCFTDGFVLAQDFVVLAGQRLENVINDNAGLLAQNANGRYFYSIEVVSDIPVIAMMSHYDLTLGNLQPSGGGITIGTQRGSVVALADL